MARDPMVQTTSSSACTCHGSGGKVKNQQISQPGVRAEARPKAIRTPQPNSPRDSFALEEEGIATVMTSENILLKRYILGEPRAYAFVYFATMLHSSIGNWYR